jgi:hypothetical protein
MNDEQQPADHGSSAADDGTPADGEGASTVAAVSGLMEERRKYEGWIVALDARRGATPERVFARVHADYTARLETVVAQLTAHADGLRAEQATLAMRLAELEDEQQKARDARAEAELRAHVGELSASAWESTAAERDANIAELASRHGTLEVELARTRELLSEAERPAGSPGVAAPAPAAVGLASEEDQAVAVGDVAEGDLHVPSAEDDETEKAEAPDAADAAPPMEVSASVIAAEQELIDGGLELADSSQAEAAGRATAFDEMAFLSSVVDTPAGSLDKAPADRPDESSRRDSFAMRAQEDDIVNLSEGAPGGSAPAPGSGAQPPYAENVSGNTPIIMRDKPPESGKSLKCSECGAMNYPTEWYCERCGAELASL